MLFRITVTPIEVDAVDERDAVRQAILARRNSPRVSVSPIDQNVPEWELEEGMAEPPVQTLSGDAWEIDLTPVHFDHRSGLRHRSYRLDVRRRGVSGEGPSLSTPDSEIAALITLLQSAEREIQQRHELHW